MNTTPLISVALTAFNGERYLRGQLDSLLAQDYPDFEIVAVDDASADSTGEILDSYSAREPRLRCYRNERNLGVVGNFARAFARCRGELIAPCDQDDLWLPDKLSRLAGALTAADPAVMMAYCDSELLDEYGGSLGRRVSGKLVLTGIDDPLGFAFGNCVSGHAMLFRRELLERALPFPAAVFYDRWLAFAAAAIGRIVYVDAVLVRYRQHAAAQTDFAGRRGRRRGPRGDKRAAMDLIGRQLAAFAGYTQGREAALFGCIHRLWQAGEQQWICWRLTALLIRYRHRLYAFHRNRGWRRLRRAVKYWPGLRLKRLLLPHRYGAA
ncbi:MAG: glycosyltransferase [Gammaproteobacteria bacterium]|nr:glycosyltransferase [Gammaproteobacteria bacterium]